MKFRKEYLMKQMLITFVKKKPFIAGLIAFIIVIGMGVSTAAFMKKTETPEYCASCHVMQTQYDDWFYSGKHAQIKCIDCHLPNNNFVNHYLWKGLDGIKDVIFFYTGLVPEPVHSSRHARKTIQSNCVRCHSETVSRISTDAMNCWECHRKLWHNRTGEF